MHTIAKRGWTFLLMAAILATTTLRIAPADAQTACPSWQFRGEYWTTASPSGTPTYSDPVCAPVDYSWMERPAPGIDQGDGWSARFTQNHAFETGTYRFTLTADDRVRLVVNSATIYDRWTAQANPTTHTFDVAMTAGQRNVRLIYGDVSGTAVLELSWVKLGGSATATPTATNTPTPKPTNTPVPPTATPGGGTPVSGQPCPKALHDSITTVGPDGRTYPTWHPQIDPASGCLFGHEHGNDPALFDPTFKPPFHYADLAEDGHVHENHWGTKVYVLEDRGFGGYRWMFVQHFGTTGTARLCQRFHETQTHVKRLSDGKRVAELYMMGDYGAALSNHDNQSPYRPPECPDQANVGDTFGVRLIANVADQGVGYEPWRQDQKAINPHVDITVNTPDAVDIPRSRTDATPFRSATSKGTSRFLTYTGVVSAGTVGGTFWTDATYRTIRPAGSPGAVRQFLEPGLHVAPKPRGIDEECKADARVDYGSGRLLTDPERRPLICVTDEEQREIERTVNLSGSFDTGGVTTPN